MKTRNFYVSDWFFEQYDEIKDYNYKYFEDTTTTELFKEINSVLEKLKSDVSVAKYLGHIRYWIKEKNNNINEFETMGVYRINIYHDAPFALIFLITKDCDVYVFGLFGSRMDIKGILKHKGVIYDENNRSRFNYLNQRKRGSKKESYCFINHRLRRERLLERRLKYLERLEYLEKLRRFRRLYGA